jgi:hypothetical protein
MGKLVFTSRSEAENSELYKSKEFSRFYKDMSSQEYVIEVTDFGTCLSHHSLLKLGNKII